SIENIELPPLISPPDWARVYGASAKFHCEHETDNKGTLHLEVIVEGRQIHENITFIDKGSARTIEVEENNLSLAGSSGREWG
ncbi:MULTISPECIES: hypothetical protein, partial [unclassified Aeromonas]|uniref:hypothetical protein n=1 Tax=unclassified Aeromonas TaxID=257493 RepID=UPI0022DFAB36